MGSYYNILFLQYSSTVYRDHDVWPHIITPKPA